MIKTIFCCYLLVLLTQAAIDKDLIKVPVPLHSSRAIPHNSSKEFGLDISTLPQPTEKYTTYSLNQQPKIPHPLLLPFGLTEGQAVPPSSVHYFLFRIPAINRTLFLIRGHSLQKRG
jgi:hypothetical protein